MRYLNLITVYREYIISKVEFQTSSSYKNLSCINFFIHNIFTAENFLRGSVNLKSEVAGDLFIL